MPARRGDGSRPAVQAGITQFHLATLPNLALIFQPPATQYWGEDEAMEARVRPEATALAPG